MKRWDDFTEADQERIREAWVQQFATTISLMGAAVPSESWMRQQADEILPNAWFSEEGDLVIQLLALGGAL